MSVWGAGGEGEGEADRDLQISSRNGFSFPCWLRSDSEIFFFPTNHYDYCLPGTCPRVAVF